MLAEDTLSSFVCAALCEEKNILTQKFVKQYKSVSPKCMVTMAKGYENNAGESCSMQQPQFSVEFHDFNPAQVSKVVVQRDYNDLPGNVRKIQVQFLDMDNKTIVDEVTGEPIQWISPDDDPVVEGDLRNVKTILVKVLKTDNNENVKRFRLKVLGCYANSEYRRAIE